MGKLLTVLIITSYLSSKVIQPFDCLKGVDESINAKHKEEPKKVTCKGDEVFNKGGPVLELLHDVGPSGPNVVRSCLEGPNSLDRACRILKKDRPIRRKTREVSDLGEKWNFFHLFTLVWLQEDLELIQEHRRII
ncbi:unnamed protein product [Vicia faba]|uniref:Uncharacterized protein n=1 Tax=Vicia faba TaxID=3906 RepID=A0AAV0ZKS2_VICFA|nr:unnamed protein product [Vicia faba]